jgi:hypothetical protein
MTKFHTVNLNTVRSLLENLPREQRRAEATRNVKMLLAPRHAKEPISDAMIPDYLVTDAMVERFLEICPPIASVISDFQEVISEIEAAYVRADFFSAVSAACVTIERLLNLARMELHKYHAVIKELWGKGPLNEWYGNINALCKWGYLDTEFANELTKIFTEIRCKYCKRILTNRGCSRLREM